MAEEVLRPKGLAQARVLAQARAVQAQVANTATGAVWMGAKRDATRTISPRQAGGTSLTRMTDFKRANVDPLAYLMESKPKPGHAEKWSGSAEGMQESRSVVYKEEKPNFQASRTILAPATVAVTVQKHLPTARLL